MNYNNLAERTNFIAGSPAFEHVPFFLSNINIPEISIDHPEITGGRFSHNMKLPGDTIRYGILSFEMLIDEDLLIYDELYRLLEKNTNPETNTFGDFQFDFFIEITNNKGHSVLVFHFDNCRISSIGNLLLDTTDDSTNYRLNVDIQFDRFYPERKRRYNLSGEYDIIRHRKPKVFTNEWTNIFNLDDYVLWGLPEPKMIHNLDMDLVLSMNQPYNSNQESGLVLKKGFESQEEFEVKVQVEGSQKSLRFGITEGSGIRSSINGRTGMSLIEVHPDSSGEYTIRYTPMGEIIQILLNDELHQIPITHHSEVFLFFQGLEGTNIKNIEYRLN